MTFDELKILLTPSCPISDQTIEKFKIYVSLLKEWNEKINLTSITEDSEILAKHIYDCLIPLQNRDLANLKIADVGTGAGLPGILYAIVFPKAHITLIEATGKKCTFLAAVKEALSLTNVEIKNCRVEELKDDREHYDFVVARAVAPLPILLEAISPLAKVGGTILAMKGFKGEEELRESENALAKLHLKLIALERAEIPDGGERVNLFFTKERPTEKKYPRRWAEIEKRPL